MKLSWKIYLFLVIVIICSIITTILLPAENVLRYIYSSPSILALFGILYQIFRDESKYQKGLLIQHDQQLFDLGTTTHMANVVFNKHVIFCEDYMKEVHNSLETLFREGPSPTCLTLADKLLQIRINHSTWLTNDIDNNLELFEKALRSMGADANHYRNDPASAVDSGATKHMYTTFKNIFGLKESNNDTNIDPKIASSTIIRHLRDILRIEELTNLRQYLISFKNKG